MDMLKAFFPGESMWVQPIDVDGHTMIAELKNTPLPGMDMPEGADKWLRKGHDEPLHDLREHGELVVLKKVDAQGNVPPFWLYSHKHEATQ